MKAKLYCTEQDHQMSDGLCSTLLVDAVLPLLTNV